MSKPGFNTAPSGGGFPFSIPIQDGLSVASGQLGGWMSCIGRLQNEILSFAQARFRSDVSAMERFARCRKPEEIVEAQATFLAQIYSDYAKENLKIAGMLAETAQWTREKAAEAGVRSP
jgi:hypothetical protein